MNSEILLPQPSVPAGGAVLNPFVIVDDAAGLAGVVCGVFGVAENAEVRTQMPDGKLIHAQLRLGGVDLMIADRLAGWPRRPGLLQVWVRDVAAVLQRAAAAATVAEPTPFYGEVTLGRMLDDGRTSGGCGRRQRVSPIRHQPGRAARTSSSPRWTRR